MVLILYMCFYLAKKAGITLCLKDLERYVLTNGCASETDPESDIDSLPDRLINPGEYEPLPPSAATPTIFEPTDSENKEPDNKEPRRLTPVYTYGSICC